MFFHAVKSQTANEICIICSLFQTANQIFLKGKCWDKTCNKTSKFLKWKAGWVIFVEKVFKRYTIVVINYALMLFREFYLFVGLVSCCVQIRRQYPNWKFMNENLTIYECIHGSAQIVDWTKRIRVPVAFWSSAALQILFFSW